MPESAAQIMLILKALDPGASVKFSEWTGQWYVEASIEVGDGSVLTGGTEHRDSPDDAVRDYFARLTAISLDEYVATRYCGQRREWRWNGAAFAEITRREAMAHA